MGTYFADSGSAGNSLSGELYRLASEFEPAIRASRIGHLLGAKIPEVQPGTKASFSYLLRSMFVDASDLNPGNRIIGQPVPVAEAGKWKDVSGVLSDWGEMAVIDGADGYILGNNDDFLAQSELGVRLSLTHALDVIDKRCAEVLGAGSTPWSAADQAASGSWESNTYNPLADILSALTTHEGTAGNEALTPNRIAMCCGTRTYRAMLGNTNMTALFGGSVGMGVLSDEQLRSALSSVGISDLFVGIDAYYSSTVTLYSRPPGDSATVFTTPSGRMVESAGIITPHAGVDFFHTREHDIDPRRYGVYVYAHCDPAVIVPEFGIRITGTYT